MKNNAFKIMVSFIMILSIFCSVPIKANEEADASLQTNEDTSDYRVIQKQEFNADGLEGTFCLELQFEVFNSGSFRQIKNFLSYRAWIEGEAASHCMIDRIQFYQLEPASEAYPCIAFDVSYTAILSAESNLQMNSSFMSLQSKTKMPLYYNHPVRSTFTIELY